MTPKEIHYYHILGITENAGEREIKNAFRRKAKEFHPDINKSEGAHEMFVDINEAYTYLINHRNTVHRAYSSPAGTSNDAGDRFYRQWMERERQRAREMAAKRARMKFEEFEKSSIYRTTSMLSHMLDYFQLLIGVFVIGGAFFGLFSRGLYIEDNGVEVLNITGIVGLIVISFAGVLFIVLSWSNIDSYRHNRKRGRT